MRQAEFTSLAVAAKAASEALGVEIGWCVGDRVHLRLPDQPGHTIALSLESAGRIRVDRCHLAAIRGTRWVFVNHDRRLARVVQEMASTPVVA